MKTISLSALIAISILFHAQSHSAWPLNVKKNQREGWGSEIMDRNQRFKRGRNGRRGNERSERVGRVDTGAPVYGGRACPDGSMRVIFAPDYLSFSILFDKFEAKADGRTERRDVIGCEARIPIQIPANMRMEITRVDFRGFLVIPGRASGHLRSVFNFAGLKGGSRDRITMNQEFYGPLTESFELATPAFDENGEILPSEASPCGGPAILNMKTDLILMTNHKSGPASISLDSIDASGSAIYYVNWKSCER